MTFAGYLAQRFFYRIAYFLRDWYVVGGKKYADFFLSTLERLDRTLAWKINILHLFTPLYKDYSFTGYLLGLPLRVIRFVATSVLYIVIFAIAIIGYAAWVAVIPYIVYRIFA